jgi:hypothetical protein
MPRPCPNFNFEPETSLESTSVEKTAVLVDWMVCNTDREWPTVILMNIQSLYSKGPHRSQVYGERVPSYPRLHLKMTFFKT